MTTDKQQIAINTDNIAGLVESAKTAQKVEFLENILEEHVRKQNGTMEKQNVSMEKMADSILRISDGNIKSHDEMKTDYREGLLRVYEKIDEQLGKSIPKTQATLLGLMASVLSALILYVILGGK